MNLKKFSSVLFAILLICLPINSAWSELCDGTDDNIIVTGYLGIAGTNARSLSFWFKSTDTDSNPIMLSWGDNGTGAGEGFRFSLETDGKALELDTCPASRPAQGPGGRVDSPCRSQ